MRIRVVWYDFAGNESSVTYDGVEDWQLIEGNLYLLKIEKGVTRQAFVAVYPSGEWHHIEKVEFDKSRDVPDVYREAE